MNLAQIMDDHDADSVALISRGRETNYGDLRDQIAHLRGGLASLGVGRGDRVALLCGNSRHFVITYFATVGLGAVAVPLNPLSPGPELQAEIATVGAKVVVIEQLSASTWSNVDRSKVPSVETVVSTERDGSMPEDALSIDGLLAVDPVDVAEIETDEIATLIFTSGTAGFPRAAKLTHRNLLAAFDQITDGDNKVCSDDVIYAVLPLFHIFGLNIVLTIGLHAGATVVLVQRFDAYSAYESVRDRGVTILPGAPAMWAAFTQLEELPADAFSTVRIALSGASRLPVSVFAAMRERFDIVVAEGYGLTETSATVSTSLGQEMKPGSVGRAFQGVEIRLIRDGSDVLVGDVGEIWVRGVNVFAGYYEDPAATAAVLTDDGWLKTGDLAMADDDGYMFLVDRAKDLVIVSGFNVYPAEVEQVLLTHPEVDEVGEDGLIEYALDRLARYKCPSKIMFVDELPRNATGKLVRRRLDGDLEVR